MTRETYTVFFRRSNGSVAGTPLKAADEPSARALARRQLHVLREHPEWKLCVTRKVELHTVALTEIGVDAELLAGRGNLFNAAGV
jgi:hypothetical protein